MQRIRLLNPVWDINSVKSVHVHVDSFISVLVLSQTTFLLVLYMITVSTANFSSIFVKQSWQKLSPKGFNLTLQWNTEAACEKAK